jgi:hypothetical protein
MRPICIVKCKFHLPIRRRWPRRGADRVVGQSHLRCDLKPKSPHCGRLATRTGGGHMDGVGGTATCACGTGRPGWEDPAGDQIVRAPRDRGRDRGQDARAGCIQSGRALALSRPFGKVLRKDRCRKSPEGPHAVRPGRGRRGCHGLPRPPSGEPWLEQWNHYI